MIARQEQGGRHPASTSYSQALAEVIEARIWGGVHTRSADVQGAEIGTEVVASMTAHYFKPLR